MNIAVINVTWSHVLFLFLGNRFLSNRSLNSVTSQTDKIVISLPIIFCDEQGQSRSYDHENKCNDD